MSQEGIENIDSQSNSVPVEQASAPVETTQSQPREFNPRDYVHKDRVNEIVHERTRKAAHNAAEKAREEMRQQTQSNYSAGQDVGMGGIQPSHLNESQIRKLMQDELGRFEQTRRQEYEEKAQADMYTRMANDFIGKLEAAKDQYPDLQKRANELVDLGALVPVLTTSSETAGIVNHLLNNDAALGSLLSLAHYGSKDRLINAVKRIEDTLRNNREALQRDYPNAPLSQPSPSPVATKSGNGTGQISALRKQSYLRG